MTVGAGKDDAQANEKSSTWSNRRSGLEMLRAVEPIEPALTSDESWLEGLRATDATWREWRGVEHLRLWEALALHHHLDPHALGLTQSSKKRFSLMLKRYALDFDSVLGIFGCQGVGLVDYVRNGVLRVERTCDPLGESVVSVQEFLRVFGENRVLADPSRQRGAPGLNALAEPPQKYSSPYVEQVVAASALYRTVADGGRYVPGDLSTVPDVDGFLREHFPWMPATKRRQICEMVRPPELPKGRKPKTRGHAVRNGISLPPVR